MEILLRMAIILGFLGFSLVASLCSVYLLLMIWKIVGANVADKKKVIERQEMERQQKMAQRERAMAGMIIGGGPDDRR